MKSQVATHLRLVLVLTVLAALGVFTALPFGVVKGAYDPNPVGVPSTNAEVGQSSGYTFSDLSTVPFQEVDILMVSPLPGLT